MKRRTLNYISIRAQHPTDRVDQWQTNKYIAGTIESISCKPLNVLSKRSLNITGCFDWLQCSAPTKKVLY